MKRLIFAGMASIIWVGATPAVAADLPVQPVYKAAPVVDPVFNWSGLYFGGHLGWVRQEADFVRLNSGAAFPPGTGGSSSISDWLGGFQAGFNYMFDPNWLVGIEGDFSWTGLESDNRELNVTQPGGPPAGTRLNIGHGEVPWIATLTGRLGYAANNWLWYVKGGAAWRHGEANGRQVNPTLAPGNPNYLRLTSTRSSTQVGWTAGVGFEWGFWQNWSARIEYDYLSFDFTRSTQITYLVGAGNNPRLDDVDVDMHRIMFAINYFFRWGS